MPADEFLMWEDHFKYHPPGDYRLHYLTTLLVSSKMDPKKNVSIYDIAPWLKSPEIQKQLEEKKYDDDLDQIVAVVNRPKENAK